MTINNLTSWVEINSSALRHNFEEIRRYVGNSIKIMAVVKADAYGHGIADTAELLQAACADFFGVTSLEEGLELRNNDISKPILAFSPLLPDQFETALVSDIDQTVCDPDLAGKISKAAVKLGKKARVHVKVDTGMGRLGISVDDCISFTYRLMNLPGIEIAGIYTHFADAGSKDITSAKKQNYIFSQLLQELESKSICIGLRHAANSSAMLNIPDSHYDMVRPGTILYGQYPTRYTNKPLELKDTWTLKTRVIAIRRLPAGSKIGYGGEFTTKRPTIAAVLPIGYSDGFLLIPESAARRAFSPVRSIISFIKPGIFGSYVKIKGRKAPVIGRISMQMCSVDVTDLGDVKTGDEVLVPARRTTTSARIPRIFI